MSKKLFQFASDLHIEYKNNTVPDPSQYFKPLCNILILGGDIGSLYKFEQLTTFLQKTCALYEKVYYVLGNHEFYKMPDYPPLSFEVLLKRAHSLENCISNLFILDKDRHIIINDTCIIGCTLWSDHLVSIPKYIVRIHGLYDQFYHNNFINDLEYIKKMIEKCKQDNLKLVVVTHYCPSYGLIPSRFEKDKLVSLYTSNLDYLLDKELVKVWCSGHIHHNFNTVSKNGTLLLSNQVGKAKDNITDFSKEFIIKI
jgi:predicted phosphodiesterase